MKSNFKFIRVALPLAALALAGCQSKTVPVGAYSAPTSSPNYTLICNFESGPNTNPNLFEIGVPGNIIQAPGTWNVINNFPSNENATMTLTGPGAAGTATACHISGAVTDTGNGVYPSVSLDGFLDANSPYLYKAYNASFFAGIKFYMNITANDTATARYFYMPTVREELVPVGSCSGAGCYNYIGYTFTGNTNGWKLFTFNFTDLAIQPYGKQITPTNMSGQNLQELLRLRWSEGRANAAGASTVDFWVDEVQFF